ncbi:MAG TPA: glycoside hydrolase family 3 N-terminal domain-containing protein [Treponemataceae bacterium]|nr:glycoside hydrolase family 3 N-terminal domain-containing protein [Treponemataceae bacterium]
MKPLPCLTLLFLMVLACCSREPVLPSPVPPETLTREQWLQGEAEALAKTLSIREQASQVLMTGIDGTTTFPDHLWRHFDGIVPGAVLLFGYNIADTPEKIHTYIVSCYRAFQTMGGRVPPFIAIDHEGGMVNRLRGITGPLPSAGRVANTLAPEEAEELYYQNGRQLRALGITMNLAPVAEILTGDNTSFLSSRSYGSDFAIVSRYVSAAVRGYRTAGVLPVVKHYPGNSGTDPHDGISTLAVTRETLETTYLPVFRHAFTMGAPAVLLSHVRVPSIDTENPFCLSSTGVSGLLRQTDSFSGLVLTDDISMDALVEGAGSSSEKAVRALRSGCDMIMTSDTDIDRIVADIADEAEQYPDFARRLENAVTTIMRLKLESGVVLSARQTHARSRAGQSGSTVVTSFDNNTFADAVRKSTAVLENVYE